MPLAKKFHLKKLYKTEMQVFPFLANIISKVSFIEVGILFDFERKHGKESTAS